jgi:hypothetical protein
VQAFGKFFMGWREEARTSKKLKSLITQFFRICIQRLRLTPQACMAFFNVSVNWRLPSSVVCLPVSASVQWRVDWMCGMQLLWYISHSPQIVCPLVNPDTP